MIAPRQGGHSLCSSLCNSREGKSAPADGGLGCKRGTLFQSCREESLLHTVEKGSKCSAELRAGPKSPQTLIEKMIDSALFCFFQQNIAGCFLCCLPPSLLRLFAKSWGCQTNMNSPWRCTPIFLVLQILLFTSSAQYKHTYNSTHFHVILNETT